MLYTRNAFHFRNFFARTVARDRDRDLDLNFIAPLHPDKNRFEKGFAKLIYANRDDVGKFLTSTALKVAVDDQAIYELIQNADDCKSSFFSVNFNEKYLLCINNGNAFTDQDMSAIINIAANYKDGEDIGTFGIGFKILHRLVGKENGRDAIINDYAGPIIFSWNKYFQLEKFLNAEDIKTGGFDYEKKQYNYEKDQENPWLIKILYTCFPSHLGEKVRLKDYETQATKFEESELCEMRDFLHNSLKNTNLREENNLKNGSIFFLKLGEGKYKFLLDGIDKIKSGLSYSLKFLNSLTKVYINGDEIKEQQVISYSKSYPIGSSEFELVSPENINRDIKFTFAYHKHYAQGISLREEIIPNFYTFFSMDDERNGFSFILHCNAFAMHNSRRFLEPNSEINQRLLPLIAKEITQYIEKQKDQNRELFLSLYANLLLSSDPQNKPQINNYFFSFLKEYLHKNIPTQNGYSSNSESVKVKATYLPIQPSDFGCSEIAWFAWQNEKFDKVLIDESRRLEKLHLKTWNIIDLLHYAIGKGKIDEINAWVLKIEVETAQIFADEKQKKEANPLQELPKRNKPYISLLTEINDKVSINSESDVEVVSQIKLFKFSDGKYYSLNQIFSSQNIIFQEDKLSSIWSILNYKLDFIISEQKISKYRNLYAIYQLKINNLILFQTITTKIKLASQLEEHSKRLSPDHKKKLFFVLLELSKDAEGKIDIKRVRDIEMFSTTQKQIMPLRKLIKGDTQTPIWLFSFKMSQYEDIPDLLDYCAKQEEIYKNIILENWKIIVANEKINPKYFYPELLKYYEISKENDFLETKELPFIATQNGFKRVSEVYFNPSLQDLESSRYRSLRDLISKIFLKELPRLDVFPFYIDKTSPLRITENQSITSILKDCENLEYREVEALLTFAKLTKENIFTKVYIESKNNRFSIVTHSNSVFQYYSNRQEINNLLSNQPNFKLFPKEFNANDFKELGIWRDKELYMKVLQTVDFSENLLPIVRESDKDVQLNYLEKLKYFSLQEGKIYDKNSFEHRCLKLAIDCYADEFQIKFAPKILINGTIRLADIAVKDDINFGRTTLSLASVLPDYKGVSNIITKIINQFSDFTKFELTEKVFPIKNKSKDDIFNELQKKYFKAIESIEQFAFVVYYSDFKKHNYYITEYFKSCKGFSETDMLQFAYEKNFLGLGTYVNLNIQDKIYPSELALDSEKIPTWILTWLKSTDKQEKLNFLSALGVHIESSIVCTIRRGFQTGKNVDIYTNVVSLSQGLLLNTLKWLNVQGYAFKGSETTKLEGLKQIFGRLTYTSDTPLLYISQITANEILYTLDISDATKYYFDTPQKQYSQKIFEVLQSKGLKLIEFNYFKHWQSHFKPIKIEFSEILDIEALKTNSVEWDDSAYIQWKVNQNDIVKIYKGEKLPYKVLFLETEIDTFTKGTSIQKDRVIYVCQSVKHDIRNNLIKYISTDELIKLYQLDNKIVQALQERNTELENQVLRLKRQSKNDQEATVDSETSTDISKNDQKEANRVAKEIVKERLENEGFSFTKGIDGYSTIDGVFKDGLEFPLVVKSYQYQEAPLKIGANEWIQLMKPNSMFWLHFGNGKLGCLKLYELLRNQDKLSITFSTENLDVEDRLEKFAELLHYFGNVHFDFNSVNPSDYSVAQDLSDYRFDERRNEEDLSGDDEDLL